MVKHGGRRSGATARGGRKPQAAAPVVLTITAMGAGGDGIAVVDGVRHFVPLTLEGETVTAVPLRRTSDGVFCRLRSVDVAAPQRVAPFCPAFGRCGGCAFQHWQSEVLTAWKSNRVGVALAQRGFVAPPVTSVVSCPAPTRRRATLALVGKKLGFREASAHTVVALDQCPVLLPELSRLLVPLRAVLTPITDDAAITMTWTTSGADVGVRTAVDPGWEQREALAAFAVENDLARLSWDSGYGAVPMAVARTPVMGFGGHAVVFPEGSFLQPSAEGEAALCAEVLKAVGDAEAVADLFCGLGTFTLPLAQRSRRVWAADADGAAIAALTAAAKPLAGQVMVTARDLFRDPLSAVELSDFDAVVFDPPRAGALAQAQALADSDVPVVVAVSCNPASFARDARVLVDGGYRMETVVPVDQFPLSPHLEVVAVFRR